MRKKRHYFAEYEPQTLRSILLYDPKPDSGLAQKPTYLNGIVECMVKYDRGLGELYVILEDDTEEFWLELAASLGCVPLETRLDMEESDV